MVRVVTAIYGGLDADGDGRLSEQELVRYGEAVGVSAPDASAPSPSSTPTAPVRSPSEFLLLAKDFWQGSDPEGDGRYAFGQVG